MKCLQTAFVTSVSRTIYPIFAWCLLGILLSGCAWHLPKYPPAWSPLLTSKGSCVDLVGTYKNAGQTENALGSASLQALLFPSTEWEKTTSTVRLKPVDGLMEAVATLPDGTTRNYVMSDDGKCTRLERYFKDPDHRVLVNNDFFGVGNISFALYRAEDGSLVVKRTEKTAGLMIIVPLGIADRQWYRFAETQPASSSAPGAGEASK